MQPIEAAHVRVAVANVTEGCRGLRAEGFTRVPLGVSIQGRSHGGHSELPLGHLIHHAGEADVATRLALCIYFVVVVSGARGHVRQGHLGAARALRPRVPHLHHQEQGRELPETSLEEEGLVEVRPLCLHGSTSHHWFRQQHPSGIPIALHGRRATGGLRSKEHPHKGPGRGLAHETTPLQQIVGTKCRQPDTELACLAI
mmetsp:Transcript_23963/g.70299  ORF Transcript_23963/g.70299 Transcript_23963/m.70299 type:complete len:200 (-) Transcript_23963:131-730(-)